MKYRKKPVVIEAFRFQIDEIMPDWFNEKRITNEIITYKDGTCEIKTLEGVMKADKGDFIILGVNGEVYPCKPDIFDKTYETVTEEVIIKYWERSTDNNHCRELTLNDKTYWDFIYEKQTNKLLISHQDFSKDEETKHKNTPSIPIKDLIWLINGKDDLK